MTASPSLTQAVEALWRIPRPGPDNLLAAPAFVALSDLCRRDYGGDKPVFALSAALRSLGLPCQLPKAQAALSIGAAAAANAIDQAYTRPSMRRRHICPLDLADDLPPLAFGAARVAQFSADELALLFDAPRLARNFPNQILDTERLAQFHWLVVEEDVAIDRRAEARAVPFFCMTLNRDFGEIDPHLGRFPPAVESALFFLLLAPWEDWARMPEVDWRGFRVPWIYTLDEDLFVRPAPPPSADSLTLEPWIVEDRWGEEIELERPTTLPLDDDAQADLARFTEAAWQELQAARATTLFETPIAHFLVRAFLADGMDEVMAHLTTIEAAMGLEMDHLRGMRPKPDSHAGRSPSDRVAARIAAILQDPASVQTYRDLFGLRSKFVHGRAGLQNVSTPERISARRLARGVARGLVGAAVQPPRPRVEILSELLDSGVRFL